MTWRPRPWPGRAGPAPLVAAVGVLATLVLVGCGGGGEGGEPAPTFAAVTMEGDSVSLAGLRGSPVLLNVWATWCGPCRQEIPELQALHEAHVAEGLRVVGVTVDARSAGEDVRAFVERFGMTYDVWWDPDQSVVAKFRAAGVPLTVLIDAEGRIRWRHLGALKPNDPTLREAIATVL